MHLLVNLQGGIFNMAGEVHFYFKREDINKEYFNLSMNEENYKDFKKAIFKDQFTTKDGIYFYIREKLNYGYNAPLKLLKISEHFSIDYDFRNGTYIELLSIYSNFIHPIIDSNGNQIFLSFSFDEIINIIIFYINTIYNEKLDKSDIQFRSKSSLKEAQLIFENCVLSAINKNISFNYQFKNYTTNEFKIIPFIFLKYKKDLKKIVITNISTMHCSEYFER